MDLDFRNVENVPGSVMNDSTTIAARPSGRIPGLSPIPALALLAIAINAPFLGQAFHMDDGLFLMLARNVHGNFWFPQDMPVLFEGLFGPDLASTEHPWPITPYLMALCARIGGYSEVWLHAGFLVFPVIMAVSMYAVARHFTRHPALASVTLLCLPCVYVMSHTLMTDIPLLSLWLASLAFFCEGIHSGRMSQVWAGAAVSSVALLLSYSGACLVLLLISYAILHRDRPAAAVALAVPGSAFAAWTVASYFHYHRITPGLLIGAYLFARRVLSPELLVQKLVYVILSVGAVTVFPLLLPAAARRRAVAAGVLLGALSAAMLAGKVSGACQMTMLLLFLVAGIAAVDEGACVMAASLCSFRRNRHAAENNLFLSSWFLGMLLFCLPVFMTGSSRYILPALPPLVLIILRRIESRWDERMVRRFAAANLVLGGSLALALASADYQFAGIYREFASSVSALRTGSGTRLWFAGEWGLRTYLERLGGQELGRRDARPKPGDLLVVPRLATPYKTLYSDTLALDSVVIVAPARLKFDLPPLPRNCALVCTLGMPYYTRSDGLDFTLRFQSMEGTRVLHSERLLPADGRRWQVREIPLDAMAGQEGAIEFAADAGGSGNADADWLALAHARICRKGSAIYDFREHLRAARVESVPGVQYHTERNLPVLPMTIWLEQEPATVLRSRREYSSSFPLRLLDDRSHAGFWGSSWGLLPFSFSRAESPLESISVYEVTRQADAYGETTPSWYKR